MERLYGKKISTHTKLPYKIIVEIFVEILCVIIVENRYLENIIAVFSDNIMMMLYF